MDTINLNSMPQTAKRELIDFYEFLLQKYGKSDEPPTHRAASIADVFPRKSPDFTPLGREEANER